MNKTDIALIDKTVDEFVITSIRRATARKDILNDYAYVFELAVVFGRERISQELIKDVVDYLDNLKMKPVYHEKRKTVSFTVNLSTCVLTAKQCEGLNAKFKARA